MIRKSPALGLFISILVYFALWLLIPKATFLPAILKSIGSSRGIFPAIAAILLLSAPTVVFMAIQIAIVYHLGKLKPDFWKSALILGLCLAGALALMLVIVGHSGIASKLGRALTFREHLVVVSRVRSPLLMPYFLLIMMAAASIGLMVSIRIQDKNLLLPVVMFAAFIDFWTVTRGPVSTMMQKAPEVVTAVSAPIPHAGTGAFMPVTMIGPGDFLFMALVFAAVHRLGLNGRRNYWCVTTAMTLGMLAVLFNLLPALPALVVLAVAVVGANWREFKLSRQEKISTAIVGVLLMASLPLVWSLLRPKAEMAPAGKPKTSLGAPVKHSVKG